MNTAEHYKIALDLKKKEREYAFIDTFQSLGFDPETLKESDNLFVDRSKKGVNDFCIVWNDELVKCYYPVVELSGWGEDELELKQNKDVKIYSRILGITAQGIYKISNQGALYHYPLTLVLFELIFDSSSFHRVYRLKITAKVTGDGDTTLDIPNNPLNIFEKDYFAHQISDLDQDWEDISKGDFIITVLNWLISG